MHLDESAIVWSAPERERAGRPLLVLLHGYGSHEGDLFAMSPGLPLGPVIASLRAPVSESGGFAWWSLAGQQVPAEPDPAAIDLAATAILEWLDKQQYTRVSTLGFSQGGAMALQLLRHDPTRFTATVSIAGFIAPLHHEGDAELARVRPKVFWGRGTADTVIPAQAVDRTAEWLPSHADATIRIYEDLGHSISREELTDFSAYLAEHA